MRSRVGPVPGKNLRRYKDRVPRVHLSAFIDDSAQVIGDVSLEEDCSVYPGAIIRGDEESVTIERGVQVMDVVFIEAPMGHPVVIEEETVIGHGAILHGCQIGEGCLIGIGAIILEGAKIGDTSIIAAGALVAAGMQVKERSLVMGIPGKVARKLNSKDLGNIKRAQKEAKHKARVYKRMQDRDWDSSYIH
jgi:carbonic anhydrase/acetyltransferase-like protein (isoleucine patch superfamily)